MTSKVNEQLLEIQKLQEEVDSRLKELRTQALHEIQNLVDRFEIFSCEVKFKENPSMPRRRATAGTKVPMKYRGPNGELWSGRGRAPAWVREIEAKGQTREDYLINKKK